MTFFVAVGAGASGPDGDSANATEAGSRGLAGTFWQVTAYNAIAKKLCAGSL